MRDLTCFDGCFYLESFTFFLLCKSGDTPTSFGCSMYFTAVIISNSFLKIIVIILWGIDDLPEEERVITKSKLFGSKSLKPHNFKCLCVHTL